MSALARDPSRDVARPSLPRVAFLGLGWIGQHRLKAALEAEALSPIAFIEPSDEMAGKVAQIAPSAHRLSSLRDVTESELDGVVIATPSAAHAEQTIAALQMGLAVFCQKPLGRTEREVAEVLGAARTADRLLAVDLSYRFTAAAQTIRTLVQSGALGSIHAIDLVFHNAYGPDKPWFYDRALSGGGCVMDLGVHLLDLALWVTGKSEASDVSAQLFCGGAPMRSASYATEDLAFAAFRLNDHTAVRLACSWKLHAGQDAAISAAFYGTHGAAQMRNVGGSFYDFVAERFTGTRTELLCQPPDAWGGRAIVDWAGRLQLSPVYDRDIESIATVAAIIDRIYDERGLAPKSS